MTIILIISLIIFLYKAKFIRKGINEDYISIENTKKINGFFVLIVFLSHTIQYINYSDLWIDKYGLFIITNIGQLMVTTFLFFSGYGIYESIKKKKENYIDSIPKKRILKTLFKFDIAVLIFLIVSCVLDIKYDLKTILLSFLGWESVGNSNWYIFAIIVLYLITYIVFKLVKTKEVIKLSIITLLTLVYMIVMSKFKEQWWYNTVLCYPLGMWFSLYKLKIESVFKNKSKYYYMAVIISIVLLCVSLIYRKNIYVFSTMYVAFFIISIVLISMKIKLNSKFFEFMGNNVFYIYIYQRLPMIILLKYNLCFNNRYIFLIISFISTIAICIILNNFRNIHFKKDKNIAVE